MEDNEEEEEEEVKEVMGGGRSQGETKVGGGRESEVRAVVTLAPVMVTYTLSSSKQDSSPTIPSRLGKLKRSLHWQPFCCTS